jgi:hypothetical protein
MAGGDFPGFEVGDDTIIWRYLSAKRFADLLAGQLYLAAASQFDDQFEGAITEAEDAERQQMAREAFPNDPAAQKRELGTLSEAFEDLRRMTKVNCWHGQQHENAAMWDRYQPSTGFGVAVASTVGALKRSMREFRLRPNYGAEQIYVGAVRYIDYAAEEMTDRSMLGVFLYKRIEYRDEREVRVLLSLRMAVEFGVEIPDHGVVVSIDTRELIDEVRVCPAATSADVEAAIAATRRANLDCPVSRSTLGSRPMY